MALRVCRRGSLQSCLGACMRLALSTGSLRKCGLLSHRSNALALLTLLAYCAGTVQPDQAQQLFLSGNFCQALGRTFLSRML